MRLRSEVCAVPSFHGVPCVGDVWARDRGVGKGHYGWERG